MSVLTESSFPCYEIQPVVGNVEPSADFGRRIFLTF